MGSYGNLGVPAHLAEDLIQEMYLRLHRYVKDESKIYYRDDGPEGINGLCLDGYKKYGRLYESYKS